MQPAATPIRPRLVGQTFLLLASIAIAAIIAQAWWAIQQDRRITLESEHENALIAVRLLEEHATLTLHEAERSLDILLNAIHEEARQKPIDDALIRTVLTKAQPFNQVMKALQYVNPQGIASVSTIDYPAYQTDADDRTYIPYLLAHQEDRKIMLGRPFQRFYDAEMVVPIARNIFAQDGRYLGIISTDISVAYFSSVYARVAKDSKAMVALFSEQGNVIVRFPFELKAAGKNLAAAASIKPFQPQALEGHFEDKHFLGEESDATRFYTFRKIADYGIVAVFARERDLSLAAWRQRSAERMVFSVVAILFLSLSLFFLWKHIRRLNHTEESLRLSEASLRASERKFSDLFEQSPVPLALVKLSDGIIVEMNDSLLNQWGFSRKEVIGKTALQLKVWETPSERIGYINSLHAQGHVHELEVRLCNKRGEVATCLLSSRVFNSDGVAMIIFTPIDISRMRAIEDQIRHLNADLEARVSERTESLEHANQDLEIALKSMKNMQAEMFRSEKMAALGYLVAGISHELNTPIGNSLMVASTLKEHAENLASELDSGKPRRTILNELIAETKKGADILVRSLERAAQLIISFKQVSVDQSSNHRRSFDLGKSLEEVLLTLEPMYRRSAHKLTRDLQAGIQMESYPGALAQIVTNAISNALNHAFENQEQGLMQLSTRLIDQGQVEIIFSDNGCGISPENLKRVFDPFFTTKLGQGGSGLGMNIVYNLITEVLGGTVELHSEPGKGTSLIMRLPVIAPQHEDE
ncbi:ATP-binding protein [Undibacterium sp.]|uniref:ATP-binding protein n=1 Tax=Undibacterium sp. TaxID=1914977 RepID=UPI0025EB6652|nr:ATP-binding protein [Undibacterium sp.]